MAEFNKANEIKCFIWIMWKYVVLIGSCGCPLKMSLWQACNDWLKSVFSMESKWFLHNPVFHWGKPSVFSQREQEQFWWKEYDQILQTALLYEAQLTDQSVWSCSVANMFQPSLHLNTACCWKTPAESWVVGGSSSLGKYKMCFKDCCFTCSLCSLHTEGASHQWWQALEGQPWGQIWHHPSLP